MSKTNTEASQVKSTKNLGMVAGYLSEKNLEVEDTTYKDVNGKEKPCKVVRGSIAVETAKGLVTIQVFRKSKNNDGKDNKLFKGLETIAETYISKLDASKDDSLSADYISCIVNLSCNDYVPEGSTEVSTSTRLSLTKANRTTPEKEPSKTDMDLEGVIRSVKPEIKKSKVEGEEDEETGRLLVEFVGVNFRGEAEPYTLVIDEDLAEDFADGYNAGETCELYAEISMKHIGGDTSKKKAKFGRKAEVSSGYDILEIVVVGGETPYNDEDEGNPEKVISLDTMKTLMNERQMKLDNLVKEAKEGKKTKTGSKTTSKKGMGEKKPIDATTDDIPF